VRKVSEQQIMIHPHKNTMRISTQDFQNSFFYVGAGKDFEPLLRFSHFTENFLFTNLFLSLHEVRTYAEQFFEENSEFIEVIENGTYKGFDEKKIFELHPFYKSHLRNYEFIQEHFDAYTNAFRPAIDLDRWVLRYKLRRKGVNRPITLYYFTAEGLASYVALSHNGKYVPRVFCTIETKFLERNNGIAHRFFEQLGSKPMVWVKGSEEALYFKNIKYGRPQFRSVLQPIEPYSEVGMDFIFHWNCEGSFIPNCQDYSSKTTRHCKAFISAETKDHLIGMSLPTTGTKGKIERGSLLNVVQKHHKNNDLTVVVLTWPLHKLTQELPENIVCLYWEDIMRYVSAKSLLARFSDIGDGMEYKKFSMTKSLPSLDTYIESHVKERPSQVIFVPLGLEDEGEILADWLKTKTSDTEFIAVINRPLDCWDLLLEKP
jgi:hypothetical protein